MYIYIHIYTYIYIYIQVPGMFIKTANFRDICGHTLTYADIR